MKNLRIVVKFMFDNRRLIGTIVGSIMILSGHQEAGYFIQNMSEM